MEKVSKKATVVSNQAAAFNRYINKVHDDMQDNIRLLFNDMIGKGKSSQKMEKILTEVRDLSAFQQNIIFALGKSMEHIVDTIIVQASNMTVLCLDSYLEYL